MKKISLSVTALIIFVFSLITPSARAYAFGESSSLGYDVNTYFLPGRPFYFLKELGELISESTARDDIDRFNLELKFFNQDIGVLKFLNARYPNDRAMFQMALLKYAKKADRLTSTFKSLKAPSRRLELEKVSEELALSAVQNNITLNGLGQKYLGDFSLKIDNANKKLEEAVGFIPGKINDDKELKRLIDNIYEKYSSNHKEINALYFTDLLKLNLMDDASRSVVLASQKKIVSAIGNRIKSESGYAAGFDSFSNDRSLRLISEVIGFSDDISLRPIFNDIRKNIISQAAKKVSVDMARELIIEAARAIALEQNYSEGFYRANEVLEMANRSYFESEYAKAYGSAIEAKTIIEGFKASRSN